MPKLNLDYYKYDINYDSNITKQEENDIIEYIHTYKQSEYEKIFEDDIRVNIFSNLSDIQSNIINWYPFKQNSSVLEIGAKFGNLTNVLCDKCDNVTSIEFIKERAESICKRLEDKNNLEVICSNLHDIYFNKKFDYITIIGAVEYADIIMDSNNGLNDLLVYCKKLLKDDGVILFAIDNKVSFKDISIVKLKDDNKKLYSKKQLDNILNKNSFNYKYYYPLPDYKLTNVIYSDEYLPDSNDSKIRYNKYYNENQLTLKNELDVIKDITENNCFEVFTNSYLIEISNKLSKIKFVSFNNMRKKKYKLITIIDENKVEKKVRNEESIIQINNIKNNIELLNKLNFEVLDKYNNNNTIISEYVNYFKLDKLIINEIMINEIEKAFKLINNYFDYLKVKLVKCDNEQNYLDINNIEYDKESNLTFIKHGFIDLTFENVFMKNNNYLIFDQEWYIENIPLEFIYYRAINNILCYNPEIEDNISKDEIMKRFNIKQYVDTFKQIEIKIQSEVVDTSYLNFYSSNIGESLESYMLNEKDNLQKQIKILEEELVKVHDSRVYKFTRKLVDLFKK